MSDTINIELEITEDDLDCIMVTALEGGVNYWAGQVDIINPEKWGENDYASLIVAKGGSVLIHDIDGEQKYTLSKKKLLKGLNQYLLNPLYPAIQDGKLDVGNIDATCADMIVQYALFGELVYG